MIGNGNFGKSYGRFTQPNCRAYLLRLWYKRILIEKTLGSEWRQYEEIFQNPKNLTLTLFH
jgi:hypothetical protein